jgi:hypothetical protein
MVKEILACPQQISLPRHLKQLTQKDLRRMPARKPRPPEEKPQIERFREMARELGCDEDEDAFKAKLAQVMRHQPKVEPRKKPKD